MELALKEVLEDVLKRLGVAVDNISITKEANDVIYAEIFSPDSSLLIGWHGETIAALHHLVKNLIWIKHPELFKESGHFIIDVDGYRRKQKENVISLTERRIQIVRKTKEPQILPPMSPYFRRIVHMYLTENFTDVTTESVGKDDHRAVKIFLK